MAEGGLEAVRADGEVAPASRVRELAAEVRGPERPLGRKTLGRKTMEAEVLREALGRARPKKLAWRPPPPPPPPPGGSR
jgi:transposase